MASDSPLPFGWPAGSRHDRPFLAGSLETRLAYGDLPGVVAAPLGDRAELLRGFAFVHLEEEIRREALVKDCGAFVRFIQLAAAESGRILNFAAIAHESGVSQPTVKSYYRLLEDMFVGFRVEAFSGGPRKALLSTPKFLFFDVGLRHAAAEFTPSPELAKADPRGVFEQWVGIELAKRVQHLDTDAENVGGCDFRISDTHRDHEPFPSFAIRHSPFAGSWSGAALEKPREIGRKWRCRDEIEENAEFHLKNGGLPSSTVGVNGLVRNGLRRR